jgi:hypothetical protein
MLGVLSVHLGVSVQVEIQLQHHLREVVMVPLEKVLDLLQEVLVRPEFWARW